MSWMCKYDSGYSSPISIKGKSSWEDNPPAESEVSSKEETDNKEEVTDDHK